MAAMRTFPTFTLGHVADAAFVCSCGGTLLATQRISSERPLSRPKLGIPKPHFRGIVSELAGHEPFWRSLDDLQWPLF